jgi:hypothetical protein
MHHAHFAATELSGDAIVENGYANQRLGIRHAAANGKTQ